MKQYKFDDKPFSTDGKRIISMGDLVSEAQTKPMIMRAQGKSAVMLSYEHYEMLLNLREWEINEK